MMMRARDKLLLSTVALMQRRGVAATGVADILADSKVSRRSIYVQFPGGKPELVAEATRWSGQWIADQMAQACTGRHPREALAQFIDYWKSLLRSTNFEAGCPIVAAATARSVAPRATEAAAEAFAQWRQILVMTLNEHGVSGTRAGSLATITVAAVEGAVILAFAQRSLAPLDDVEYELAVLVDDATCGAGQERNR